MPAGRGTRSSKRLRRLPVPGARGQSLPKGRKGQLVGLKGEIAPPPRLKTGMEELDRVAGGGFVQGSAALVGGDPGIGKSTLLLQAMAALARKGEAAVYISGEEAIAQVQLRAERLSLTDAPVMLASLTNVADIIATLSEEPMAKVVVIDSIQTLWTPVIESAPGTVSQLRAGSEALIRLAKSKGISVLFVGHVTKEGDIAGPKVIEHLVDTVLYFEGDRGHQFRILRAVKNRFGPTDEIGVFEMSDAGLKEVNNPSRLFMGARENADTRLGRLRRYRRHTAASHGGAGAGLALGARQPAPGGGGLGPEQARHGAGRARGAGRRRHRRAMMSISTSRAVSRYANQRLISRWRQRSFRP